MAKRSTGVSPCRHTSIMNTGSRRMLAAVRRGFGVANPNRAATPKVAHSAVGSFA
jgi:hypothetical protein